jgi:hypothetical protein
MGTFITALAVSAAVIVPLTAQAGSRAHAHAGSRTVSHAGGHLTHARGQQFVARSHIYWQGRDLGTDPDPYVRFEIRRDADLSASNH